MPRYFADIIDVKHAIIRGRDVAHISGPLRKRPGDMLLIRDMDTGYIACIKSMHAGEISLEILEQEALHTRGERVVHLGVCLIPPKDLDEIIRYAAELGVQDIQPVVAARSNIRHISDSRLKRWDDIILEAVKQSQRRTIPRIHPMQNLEEFARTAHGRWPERLLAVRNAEVALSEITSDDVGILIGPEGGFAPDEEDVLIQNGFLPVHMGRTTLRSMTAALAAAAILCR